MAGNSVTSGIAIKSPEINSRGESGKDKAQPMGKGCCIPVPAGVKLDNPMTTRKGE